MGLHPRGDRAKPPVIAGRNARPSVCRLRIYKEKARPILTTPEGYWQRFVTEVVTTLVTVERVLTVAHKVAIRPHECLREATGEPALNIILEVMSRKFLSNFS